MGDCHIGKPGKTVLMRQHLSKDLKEAEELAGRMSEGERSGLKEHQCTEPGWQRVCPQNRKAGWREWEEMRSGREQSHITKDMVGRDKGLNFSLWEMGYQQRVFSGEVTGKTYNINIH